ncbi:MAG: DHHA1 domain-containing protein [Thermoguttaceae bacterium]|nr:DHHA1 domain-containing protein [Thermoguttaceae bacterium]
MRIYPVNGTVFTEKLRICDQWLIMTHGSPDADAIGTATAVAMLIEKLGKKTRLLGDFVIPPNLRFLDPTGRFERLETPAAREAAASAAASNTVVSSDTVAFQPPLVSAESLIALGQDGKTGILVVDTSAWKQLGGLAAVFRAFSGPKMVMDHHIASDDLGEEVSIFRDEHSAAAGCVLLKLIESSAELLPLLDAVMATSLFAAMATDTGWFRFSSVTSATYRAAARLIDTGVVPAELYQEIYEQYTVARQKLFGRVMDHLSVEPNALLASTFLTQQDFQETGAIRSDSEDMVNELLRIKGIQVAVIFIERDLREIRMSFRSRGTFDCAAFARQMYGGGGHQQAAGATNYETLEETRVRTLDALRSVVS